MARAEPQGWRSGLAALLDRSHANLSQASFGVEFMTFSEVFCAPFWRRGCCCATVFARVAVEVRNCVNWRFSEAPLVYNPVTCRLIVRCCRHVAWLDVLFTVFCALICASLELSLQCVVVWRDEALYGSTVMPALLRGKTMGFERLTYCWRRTRGDA